MPTTRAHQSIYRNISGVRRFFSFLGPNGAWLNADQDVAITGDLNNLWRNDSIQTAAYRAALGTSIIPLKSPDVFVYDATDDMVFRLGADNSAPTVVDPDFGSYSGSSPDPT